MCRTVLAVVQPCRVTRYRAVNLFRLNTDKITRPSYHNILCLSSAAHYISCECFLNFDERGTDFSAISSVDYVLNWFSLRKRSAIFAPSVKVSVIQNGFVTGEVHFY